MPVRFFYACRYCGYTAKRAAILKNSSDVLDLMITHRYDLTEYAAREGIAACVMHGLFLFLLRCHHAGLGLLISPQ
ncbi:hypothetical protein [Serratia rhizosphaerae]|uniref:Uncharacterized protein n=1 Tax=Serratia rhizosphaerae TaxID=2597702 RepID=A0ABX6GS63_9GAMM|nr:hypothetical protein [Serratia rhizosphaerae]MEB6336388.1 hypothetical protein [Serratia rhizosphaerae]QHA89111.1 hypothetical protein FO014_20150 [Serratia rhizosphaerae]